MEPYNTKIKRGITFQRDMRLMVDATTPFDLTGSEIKSQLGKSVDDPDKVDFTIEFNPDPTTGRFKWKMTYDVTETLELRDYVYDILLRTPAPIVTILLREGRIKSEDKVTDWDP